MESESWPRNYSIFLRPLLQHLVLSCPVCRTGDRNRRPAHFISPIYRSSVPNKIHQHVGEAVHGQISRGNDASLIRRRRRRHEVVELGRERGGQIQYTILLKFIFLPSSPSFPPSPSYYYPCHLRTIRPCPVPSSASRPYCGRWIILRGNPRRNGDENTDFWMVAEVCT